MTFFKKLQKDYAAYDKERRCLVKVASDILNLSKRAIFSFHRGDIKGGEAQIQSAEKLLSGLKSRFASLPKLKREGVYRAALEEYVEAKFFRDFLLNKKIDKLTKFDIDADCYMAGLCDLTGEIFRKAVVFATEKKDKEVLQCKEKIEEIISFLIQMDLTGYLRTKYDQAKTNLKKIEQLLYEATK